MKICGHTIQVTLLNTNYTAHRTLDMTISIKLDNLILEDSLREKTYKIDFHFVI